MNGRFGPEHPFFYHPWYVNFFKDPGLAQFDHRIGAYLAAAGAVVLFVTARKLKGAQKISARALLGVVLLQILLGILTLFNQVPIALAALHQITAVFLFSTAIWHAYELSGAPARAVQPLAASP